MSKDLITFNYYSSYTSKRRVYESFKLIFKSAFFQEFEFEKFKWKYLDHYSKNSIIQEIKVNNKTAGYRGLWKVSFYPSIYQCVDTCIHPSYQRIGLFQKSNKELIKEFKSFYNYPNPKSKAGYLKSGWLEIGKMNIYLNKISYFEYSDWSKEFLHWRFVKHPYIKYFKIRLKKGGFAVVRFKKGLPVHVESVKHDLDLTELPTTGFILKYSIYNSGLKVKSAGGVVSYKFNGLVRSSYFDMI